MVIGIENLAEVRQKHREQRIVIRTGCYDLLHMGHVQGLELARFAR